MKSRVFLSGNPTIQESSLVEITDVVLITSFDMDIVHFEFIPQSQTVSQAYYVEILKRLRETVRRKRPEIRRTGWILHHDNAPAHTTLPVK
jgi:hypothetical protein